MKNNKIRIIIDADGSPVKEETIQVAGEYDLEVLVVTTIDHFQTQFDRLSKVKYIYVDAGPDAVDYRIVAEAVRGDLVITQDYGLASLLVPHIRALHHSGREFTTDNLPFLLQQRHDSQMLRRSGKKTKGPAKFTGADRQHFKQILAQILSSMVE